MRSGCPASLRSAPIPSSPKDSGFDLPRTKFIFVRGSRRPDQIKNPYIFMKGDKNKTSNKKILAIFILIMAAGIASYYYLPIGKSFAEQIKALVMLALNGTKEQVRGFIDDKILPKNPEEQRKILINELKNNLDQLKKKISGSNSNSNAANAVSVGAKNFVSSSRDYINNESVNNLIDNSQNLINQLENTNGNNGVVQTAAERILEVILPIKEKTVDCNKL